MYDALNKGFRQASGEVVGVLHADDVYADDRVLAKVVEAFEKTGADSCYGDLEYITAEPPGGSSEWSEALTLDGWRVVRRWRAGGFRPEAFYWGWMPPHPTFFVRRSIYEKYGMFRLDLGTAADYELMLRFLLKHRISTTYIPDVLVRMRLGGKSTVSLGARLRANEKDRKAWYVNDLRPYPWTIPLKPLRKLPQFLRDGLLWRMLLNRGG
jgi:glycosyltransferase